MTFRNKPACQTIMLNTDIFITDPTFGRALIGMFESICLIFLSPRDKPLFSKHSVHLYPQTKGLLL